MYVAMTKFSHFPETHFNSIPMLEGDNSAFVG